MPFAPRTQRLIATMLALALLVSSLGATPAADGCHEACPCCQARKAGGQHGSCCQGHEHARRHRPSSGSCCQKKAVDKPARPSCCSQQDKARSTQQLTSHLAAFQHPADRALCLCGVADQEPVLPTAISSAAFDRNLVVHDVAIVALLPVASLGHATLDRPSERAGPGSALALRAVLCCWRT